ncbi:YgeY family selenium metabolism-linked hydrolase [bacterium]|nr:YgeY family selenium metabolism-linked hydrolase [bacterium]
MNRAAEILKKAHAYSEQTSRLLSGMVRIPSLSGQEREVIDYIGNACTAVGCTEVRVDGLGNLVVRVGDGPRKLAIDAHIDTVDVGQRSLWDFEPFSGEIRDGHVHGRGSVDQEGGAAAMITAARILKELDYSGRYSVFFTFTVMEEDCDGMCWNYLIEQEHVVPDLVLITEPTNLGLYRGQRGRMEMEITVEGRSCHGSAPERGINAIYRAARIALEIEKLHQCLPSDDFLGKGSLTVTRIVSDSPSLCAVPDHCQLHLDRRLTRGETEQSALAEIRACLSKEATVSVPLYEKPSYRGTVYKQPHYFPTWQVEADHPLVLSGVATYQALFGQAPRVDKWTFSTNGVATCGKHGLPTIGFGPGNEIMAHAPNERVPVEHLVKASAFYALFPFVLDGMIE